jgi:hypothetical protein
MHSSLLKSSNFRKVLSHPDTFFTNFHSVYYACFAGVYLFGYDSGHLNGILKKRSTLSLFSEALIDIIYQLQ